MSSKVVKKVKLTNTIANVAAVSFINVVAPYCFHVSIHAKPGARQSAIVPPVTRSLESLEVRLAAPPVDGAANAELISLLEEEITRLWREINNNNNNNNNIACNFITENNSDIACSQVENSNSSKLSNSRKAIDAQSKKQNKYSNTTNNSNDSCSINTSNAINNANNIKISVSFVKGTTSRSKVVAVNFPGNEEQLFDVLERASK